MAIGSKTRLFATRIVEAWLEEHTQFLEKLSATAGGNDDIEQRLLQRVVDWLEFHNFCHWLAAWMHDFDDQNLDSSPLCQFGEIAFSLGLPEGLRNAALLLCNKLRSEIGMPGAVVRRQGIPEAHEPLTIPFSLTELGRVFCHHRNRVRTKILPLYLFEQVGRKYRMRVQDMPPDYLAMAKPPSIPKVKNRKDKL